MRGFAYVKEDAEIFRQIGSTFIVKEIKDKYDTYYINNKGFDSACRLVRFFANEHEKFVRKLIEVSAAFKINLKLSDLNGMPLCFLNDKTEKITLNVFPNIKITNLASFKQMTTVSPYVFPELLEETAADLLKANGYIKTYKQAWTRVKRQDRELTIDRVLTRYVPVFKDKPAAIIRDIAESIIQEYKPLMLHYADTKETMIQMYSQGGPSSCMVYSSAKKTEHNISLHHRPESFGFLCDFFKTHPAEWYLCFGAKGVFSLRNNVVQARALLFPMNKEKTQFSFGRVYASSDAIRTKFIESLIQAGYKELTRSFTDHPEPFEVPVYFNEGAGGIPFPYLDNVSSVYMHYDKKARKAYFSIGRGPAKFNLIEGHQRGYIYVKDSEMSGCASCKELFPDNELYSPLNSKKLYCVDCMKINGYVHALQSDGFRVWVDRTTVISSTQGEHFTTHHAMQVLGFSLKLNYKTMRQLYNDSLDTKANLCDRSATVFTFDPKYGIRFNLDEDPEFRDWLRPQCLTVASTRGSIYHVRNIATLLRAYEGVK